MSKIRLEAARELIVIGNYGVARSILMTMQDNVTAKAWLDKLDRMAPPPLELSQLSDEDLILQLSRNEAVEELLLRVFRLLPDFYLDEKVKHRLGIIVDRLIDNIGQGDFDRIVPALVALILKRFDQSIYYGVDDHTDRLLALLSSEKHQTFSTAVEILGELGTLAARIALLGSAHSSDKPTQIIVHKQAFNKSVPVQVLVVREAAMLFEIPIQSYVNDRGIVSFVPRIPIVALQYYLDISLWAIEVALDVIEILSMERANEEEEEDGWRTYLEDIAPHEDDYDEQEDADDLWNEDERGDDNEEFDADFEDEYNDEYDDE